MPATYLLSNVVLLLLVSVQYSNQISPAAGNQYIAAVVQYGNDMLQDSEYNATSFNRSLRIVSSAILTAGSVGVDILVFPEGSINNTGCSIPAPEEHINPCLQVNSTLPEELKNLSCTVRRAQVYVVISLKEVEEICVTSHQLIKCTRNVYSTNVVFDRNGTIISRYRKFHLFARDTKSGIVSRPHSQHAVFHTDFGVDFGIFVSYDIMFNEGMHLVGVHGITDMILPNSWVSRAPFWMGLQYQASWSRALNINLLAAGYNPLWLSETCTGIHAGDIGTLAPIARPFNSTLMLVAAVPKKNCTSKLTIDDLQSRAYVIELREEPSKLKSNALKIAKNTSVETCIDMSSTLPLKPHNAISVLDSWERWTEKDVKPSLQVLLPYKSKSIPNTNWRAFEETVCHNLFCCSFNFTMNSCETPENYSYHLVAYSGVIDFEHLQQFVQVCAIVRCLDGDNKGSCVFPVNYRTTFGRVSISGNFQKTVSPIAPTTLGAHLFPLTPKMYTFTTASNGTGQVNASLVTREGLSFNVFGISSVEFVSNIYMYEHSTVNSNNVVAPNIFLMISVSLLYLSLHYKFMRS